ncbi:transglycosylase SLT domain-containing protein [Methylobacterium goesingense]|uniref:Soluble lytic murein transglycosylase-like protein n=1 Tax=Methylobacterium goesingense TaxID=243690 RepID=A0ABV2KYL3_9HYPH|nr:transglycosylase SLT domain-containing protein [Methylobacterium goesingense]GJD74435.1 hypothetical protein CFIICLFH_2669 [Methylobacterium goesingense]
MRAFRAALTAAAFTCSLAEPARANSAPPAPAASPAAVKAAALPASANICEREMAGASARHGVPLGVLYAVGLTESGKRGSLQPYAMNIQGRAYFGTSASDVVGQLAQARASGIKLVDLGCMQINHHYHREKFASLEAMIDPRQNVEYATLFLKQLKAREGSWTLAVARYHAGPNNNPAQKLYVCRVITNMVASGFGAWTPGARSFCQ